MSCKLCNKYASFGLKGGRATYCAEHKTAEMVDIKHIVCGVDSCESHPVFGVKGGKPQRCLRHKEVCMVDVKNKSCIYDGCNLQPAFGKIGGKREYCVTHKEDDMIDLKSKHCLHVSCKKQPTFGFRGGLANFCSEHRYADMVDLKHKLCMQLGCELIPIFGTKGEKAQFCVLHKKEGMIDVKNLRCSHVLCDKRPCFGLKGGKRQFCADHRTKDMINVVSKRCNYPGCEVLNPNFGVKGGTGILCASHKKEDMIDVRTKKCIVDNCNISSSYGKPGFLKSHCFQHREKGMILRPNAKCSECKELAIWGINWIPVHCDNHRSDGDENLVERQCSSCNLLYILDGANLCENCNPESFQKARLAKQNALMDYLDARQLKGVSTDSIIDGGICGKERPDRIYDFGDKIIILECDEHQHKQRSSTCEQVRMINIGQSFGGVPVYFIRWNPDSYSPQNEKKPLDTLIKRHKLCGDLIADIQHGKIALQTALISVIYLYYDGWNSLADEKWRILAEFE